MTTPPPSTLDYADLPAGSRLIVRREGGELVVEEAPGGLLFQVRELLVGIVIFAAAISMVATWVWWRYMFNRGIPVSQVVGGFLQAVPRLLADPSMLFLLVAPVVVILFASRTGRTVSVTPEHVAVEKRTLLWGKRAWSRRKIIPRGRIARIHVPTHTRYISLRAEDGKALATVLLFYREDALWLARAIRSELQLEQSD